jgi:hypothetical protein
MADLSNSISLPGDNRVPLVRLTDDIASLARMASITFGMVEKAFCPTRAVAHERGIYTFHFSDTWADEMIFAASDVMDRARLIHARVDQLEDLAPAAKPAASDRYDLLSDLEGALALISGFAEAIDELSGMKNDPARRLSGICAIASPVHDEIERAKQVCRDLYELHFAEKSTG